MARRFLTGVHYNSRESCTYRCLVLNNAILEHFRHPHNVGNLANATAIAEVANPVCGDTMRLSVRVEGGKVAEARFKTQGCVASIAAGSVLTDLMIGRDLTELHEITTKKISEALDGLPPMTMHAAELVVDALAAVLKQIG